MGLDMYLHSSELKYEVNGELLPYEFGNYKSDEFGRSNMVEIRRNVAYWRKVNCVHAWFVDNVQGGKDDRGDYFVSKGMLATLVDICERILSAQGFDAETFKVYPTLEEGFSLNEKARKIAEKELPTRDGFFFGEIEYGDSYVWDLVLTVQQLKPLLESKMDFYYSSSW